MTAPAQNKLKSVAVKLALGGVLIAVAGLIYLFFTPKIYQASAKIKVEKPDWLHTHVKGDSRNPYDPNLAPSESQIVRSDAVIDETIRNLGLIQSWSKRYHPGVPISADEARARFKSKANIRPMPNSSLIEIKITGEDREETAKIANELARVYRALHQTQRDELIHSNINFLKQLWDDQSLKVQESQAQVDKLALDINLARATNAVVYYDPDSYGRLQAKRVELETQWVEKQNQLIQLKAMDSSDLRQVLSSLDPDPDSMLNIALRQLLQASRDSISVQSDHGADSPESKRAQLISNELDGRINRIVGGIMTAKETDFAALKGALNSLNEKLKHAKKTSQTDPSIGESPAYVRAVQELQKLKKDRDALHEKINSTDANEALLPAAIIAEIMDTAETPSKPFVPDPKIALGTICVGSFLSVAGLIMLLPGQRPKPALRRS